MKFGEPNENFSTEKFMHFEPSALYQSKWEEDELGATSSETRSHADKSDKALWSASNQTDCKYFETITSSEFISTTQVCFKCHSAKCLYVANVQSPLQSSNWSANILNLNWPFRIMPIFTYEQFCECNENLSFCASCEGLADWTFSSYRANWTWQ